MELTIHQLIRKLALVLEKSDTEQREQFREFWLHSAYWFNAETEWIRQERLDVSSPP